MCVRVFLLLLHIEYQNAHPPRKARTFLGSAITVAGPHNIKGVMEGEDSALRLTVELGLGWLGSEGQLGWLPAQAVQLG